MTWDTGNQLRSPVLMLHESIAQNAKAAVMRATAIYNFNEGTGSHTNISDMKRLRSDIAEACGLVERKKEDSILLKNSPVISNFLPTLISVREMLEDPKIKPALDSAYAPQYVDETIRQINEAYCEIDIVLNPSKPAPTTWEQTKSGEQASLVFE